jgi:hypothetical protein
MNLRTLIAMGALLLAPTGFAGDRDQKDPSKENEPDLVVAVRIGKEKSVLIPGAKDLRVSDKGIASVGIAEPGQVNVVGERIGEVSVQVARGAKERNFRLVVKVTP